MKLSLRYIFSICLLGAALFIGSCKNRSVSHDPDHPGYLDRVFDPFNGTPLDSARHRRLVDSAYNALKDPGPGDSWERYYYLFMDAFRTRRNFPKAYAYIDSMLYAIAQYDDESYIERYSRTLFYKGDALLTEGHVAESFTFYYNAREAIIKMNDPCILAEYSSRLAAATFRQQRFKDAAKYYKQEVKDIEDCPRPTSRLFGELQGTLDNIGIAYARAGMNDSADLYFNKALVYIDKSAHQYPDRDSDFIDVARAVIYGNQAGVAIKRKRFDIAEKLLKESIRITNMPNHPDEDAGLSIVKLAGIYLDQKRLAELDDLLNTLAVIQKRYPYNGELSMNLNLFRSKLADQRGDKIKAYQYLLRYQAITDSVTKVNGNMGATDMQEAVDNISRQYQLDILAKDNKRKSDYLWLTIVIATMAIVIIFLIWINYRRYKKNVVTLVGLNDTVNNKNQVLLQTLAALEQSHNNNTRLLKVVAHDLRGPLGAITSIAELAADGMLPREKYEDVMAIIFRSGTKALTLANHLLIDMQNIGKLTNPEPLNIAEQLNSCVELYEHKIKEKEQKAVLKTLPAFVMGEREKLWRVFSNLISNAVKFTRVGGEISIAMRISGNNVVISIHDNGIGIPDDLKDRIFEPTEATTRPGTIGERSYGLGLSIAKNIISLHDGTLWFESSYQGGTTFYVSLPLLRTELDS